MISFLVTSSWIICCCFALMTKLCMSGWYDIVTEAFKKKWNLCYRMLLKLGNIDLKLHFFCLKNKLIIYEEGETIVTPANWKVKKEDKYNKNQKRETCWYCDARNHFSRFFVISVFEHLFPRFRNISRIWGYGNLYGKCTESVKQVFRQGIVEKVWKIAIYTK